MIYIVAANVGQARQCANDSGLKFWQWTYLHSPYQLRGTRRPVIWRHHSADQRDNLTELHEAACACGATVMPKPIKPSTYRITATQWLPCAISA